jgi:hypothetical protein
VKSTLSTSDDFTSTTRCSDNNNPGIFYKSPPTVTGGSCPTSSDNKCVCSPNWNCDAGTFSGPYDNSQTCTASFSGPATLSSNYFSTESCCDKVYTLVGTAGEVAYSGSNGPNVVVAESLRWSTDGSVLGDGFKICLGPVAPCNCMNCASSTDAGFTSGSCAPASGSCSASVAGAGCYTDCAETCNCETNTCTLSPS